MSSHNQLQLPYCNIIRLLALSIIIIEWLLTTKYIVPKQIPFSTILLFYIEVERLNLIKIVIAV